MNLIYLVLFIIMFVSVDGTEEEKGKGKMTPIVCIIQAGSNYLVRTSAYLASEGK